MPEVELTTLPSGAPISSSCSIAPRWVWNCLPRLEGDGVQPALGVGELHPLALPNGPDPALLTQLAPCSCAGEVGGRDDAGRRAVVGDDQVLVRRRARACGRAAPGRRARAGRTSPGSSGRATSADLRPRPALGRHRADPRLVDDRARPVGGVDAGPRRGRGPSQARRSASATDMSDGTSRPGRSSPATRRRGRQPGEQLGDAQRLGGADPQVDAPCAADQRRPPRSRRAAALDDEAATAPRAPRRPGRPRPRPACRLRRPAERPHRRPAAAGRRRAAARAAG